MDINVLNGTKGFENLLKFMFSNVSQFTLKSSDLNFCLTFDRLSLLFVWINLFGDFHLSEWLKKNYFAAAAALFFSACECWILSPVN